jgi:hypothetical protein
MVCRKRPRQLEPDHVDSLYNLSMVCSDRMELKEARELLSRAVELDPGHANGQVASGSRPCGTTIPKPPRARWRRRWCWRPAIPLRSALLASFC